MKTVTIEKVYIYIYIIYACVFVYVYIVPKNVWKCELSELYICSILHCYYSKNTELRGQKNREKLLHLPPARAGLIPLPHGFSCASQTAALKIPALCSFASSLDNSATPYEHHLGDPQEKDRIEGLRLWSCGRALLCMRTWVLPIIADKKKKKKNKSSKIENHSGSDFKLFLTQRTISLYSVLDILKLEHSKKELVFKIKKE